MKTNPKNAALDFIGIFRMPRVGFQNQKPTLGHGFVNERVGFGLKTNPKTNPANPLATMDTRSGDVGFLQNI